MMDDEDDKEKDNNKAWYNDIEKDDDKEEYDYKKFIKFWKNYNHLSFILEENDYFFKEIYLYQFLILYRLQ